MLGEFRLRLVRNTKEILFDRISQEGVVYRAPLDSFPRRSLIEVWPRGNVTPRLFAKVRKVNKWKNDEDKLQGTVTPEGYLLFQSEARKAFPLGYYTCRVWFEGFRLKEKLYKFRITKGDDLITVQADTDKRRIALSNDEWDAKIRTVLDNSEIDGNVPQSGKIAAWLGNPFVWAQRRACLLNLLSVLRTSPDTNSPFIDQIQSIFYIASDRIYAKIDPQMEDRIKQLISQTVFYREGEARHPVHRELLIRAGVDGNLYHPPMSYRQEGRPSMQICITRPKSSSQGLASYAEFDLDLGNPLQDLFGLIVHIGEVLDPGRTDHISIHDMLDEDPTDRFLYYTVVAG